jgi:hypothetical protein
MAKFTNKDLRLEDGQKITWGDALDASIWWDGVANQLNVDTTISGVLPIEIYHLATKEYVDDALSTISGSVNILRGKAAISGGASDIVVNFSDIGHTNYTVNISMENTTDSPPSIYMCIVSARTTNSFTVTFTGDMDSANYFLNWVIIED